MNAPYSYSICPETANLVRPVLLRENDAIATQIRSAHNALQLEMSRNNDAAALSMLRTAGILESLLYESSTTLASLAMSK